MNKLKVLLALAQLDDEAFEYLVLALLPSAQLNGAYAQVWPDGVGGFRDSALIAAVRTAATEYITSEA